MGQRNGGSSQPFLHLDVDMEGISSAGATIAEQVRRGSTMQGLMRVVREDYSIFIYCHSSS